jgi:hypothetical protein
MSVEYVGKQGDSRAALAAEQGGRLAPAAARVQSIQVRHASFVRIFFGTVAIDEMAEAVAFILFVQEIVVGFSPAGTDSQRK